MKIEEAIILWESLLSNNKDTTNIELDFKKYQKNNTRFSVEDIFDLVEIKHHACSLHFIPTSESYNNIGANVCITQFVCTDIERENLIRSVLNHTHTYGIIKAKTIEQLSNEKLEYLENIGFSVRDIYEIEHIQ